jgi:Spy/CpxP family protein refolding chaperone
MSRLFVWAVVALLVFPAVGSAADCERGQNPPGRTGAQSTHTEGRDDQNHQPLKFWIDPKLRAELGITDSQSSLIEAIWKKDLQQRSDSRSRLDKLETQLDQMMLDASLDEVAFMAQLDRVEAARTEASKARMLMLYRINKVLSPEQRAKLADKAKAMRAQRDGRGDHR